MTPPPVPLFSLETRELITSPSEAPPQAILELTQPLNDLKILFPCNEMGYPSLPIKTNYYALPI